VDDISEQELRYAAAWLGMDDPRYAGPEEIRATGDNRQAGRVLPPASPRLTHITVACRQDRRWRESGNAQVVPASADVIAGAPMRPVAPRPIRVAIVTRP
jgi:hypothetical protein